MASSRITGTNENVSTYASSGADYSALTTWEAATDVDLVTATTTEVLECEAGSYNDRLSMAGATTSALYRRIVRAAPESKHGGIPTEGVHFTGTVATGTIVSTEEYSSFQDLVISTLANSGSSAYGIQTTQEGQRFIGILIDGVANIGAGAGYGIGITASGDINIVAANCVAFGCKSAGMALLNGSTVYFYNCTSVNNDYGFRETSSGILITKNCLGSGNTTADFNGLDAASDYNASSDDTAPGSNSRIDQTFSFVDSGNDDYHLAEEDTGARSFGVSLAGDAVFPFDDDIDEMTIEEWSIGFDSLEPLASGGSRVAPFLRRRRRAYKV